MDRIVYILGAGFSAPLGIPVVRNFLMRAKDLYFGNRARYAHFAEVLGAIRDLDSVKNYLHADLFDIEEVFSIIEMQRQLGAQAPDIVKFIADVVQGYTPPLPPAKPGGTSIVEACGGDQLWARYGSFAAALVRLKELRAGRYAFDLVKPDVQYDLITLNYDQSVELPLDQIVANSQSLAPGTYHRPSDGRPAGANARTTIVKLHGDAAKGTIVPPTWDKSVRPDIKADWEAAYSILSQANHVRILGYSFPSTDTYFRFFLKAALSQTEHLKTIDILTLDPAGYTREQCQAIFAFKFTRFHEYRVEAYLSAVQSFGNLEDAHSHAMAGT